MLGLRFDAVAGVVGILFELRQALQLQEANTGVLVAYGVRELTWSGPARDAKLTAWSVGSSKPASKNGLFDLSLDMWPQPGARLAVTAERAAFFLGNVQGLLDAPPDYTEHDRAAVAGLVADWESLFETLNATFLNPDHRVSSGGATA